MLSGRIVAQIGHCRGAVAAKSPIFRHHAYSAENTHTKARWHDRIPQKTAGPVLPGPAMSDVIRQVQGQRQTAAMGLFIP
jgi:hypothetical protein